MNQSIAWASFAIVSFVVVPSRSCAPKTLLAVILMSNVCAASDTMVEAGLGFLVSRQNGDGSFGDTVQSLDVGVSSLCGLAFMAQGSTPGRGPYGDHVAKCVDYVLSCSDRSGFIAADRNAARPMYGHGFGTLFLSEVYGMAPRHRIREKLGQAVKLIVDSQVDEGGWRYQPVRRDADLSVTVCQVMALRAAKNAGLYVPHRNIDRAIGYIKSCQNADGGFAYQRSGGPSTFARSAAGLSAFICAGTQRGHEFEKGLQFLVKSTEQHDRNHEYFFYGHYYAAFVRLHAGDSPVENWYPNVRDELLRRQNRLTGAWDSKVWCREYSTAMATIILQMPKRRLPITHR